MQARLEDPKGTKTAATLPKVINKLRAKPEEASTEIKDELHASDRGRRATERRLQSIRLPSCMLAIVAEALQRSA